MDLCATLFLQFLFHVILYIIFNILFKLTFYTYKYINLYIYFLLQYFLQNVKQLQCFHLHQLNLKTQKTCWSKVM